MLAGTTLRLKAPRLGSLLFCKQCYKLSVGSVKKGQIVQFKDKAWKVLSRDNTSQGRGGSVIKVSFANSPIHS